MLGQMMQRDLSIVEILKFAAENHSDSEVVSLRTEGDIHRYNYRDCLVRVCKLANALLDLGVKKGDRVATLAWNGYRHLELYYACLLYTSPSPRDKRQSRMPSSA